MGGYKVKGYARVAFTSTEQQVLIEAESGVYFIAEDIMFKATEDCFVRFNSSTAKKIHIPSGDYLEFKGPVVKIYVVRDSKDGTLDVWSEGNVIYK